WLPRPLRSSHVSLLSSCGWWDQGWDGRIWLNVVDPRFSCTHGGAARLPLLSAKRSMRSRKSRVTPSTGALAIVGQPLSEQRRLSYTCRPVFDDSSVSA